MGIHRYFIGKLTISMVIFAMDMTRGYPSGTIAPARDPKPLIARFFGRTRSGSTGEAACMDGSTVANYITGHLLQRPQKAQKRGWKIIKHHAETNQKTIFLDMLRFWMIWRLYFKQCESRL